MKSNFKENKNYRKDKFKESKNDFNNNENSYDDIVEGRNSVIELLNSDRDINKIFVQSGERHGSINKIIAIAKKKLKNQN